MRVFLSAEIAAAAARLVVEEGMEYGPAKRKAARRLGQRTTRAGALPDNEAVEDEVRSYLKLFHADTQPHSKPEHPFLPVGTPRGRQQPDKTKGQHRR